MFYDAELSMKPGWDAQIESIVPVAIMQLGRRVIHFSCDREQVSRLLLETDPRSCEIRWVLSNPFCPKTPEALGTQRSRSLAFPAVERAVCHDQPISRESSNQPGLHPDKPCQTRKA
jgi:hypothetical protein